MNGLWSSFLTSIIAVSKPSCLVLAPVFAAASRNRRPKSLIKSFKGNQSLLFNVIRLSWEPHDSNNQWSSFLWVLDNHDQRLVLSSRFLCLVGLHHEKCQFLQGKWILKELNVLEIIIFNVDISETVRNLHLLPINYWSSNMNQCFLKLFRKLDAHLNQRFVWLLKRIISYPKVSIFTLLSMFEIEFFLQIFAWRTTDIYGWHSTCKDILSILGSLTFHLLSHYERVQVFSVEIPRAFQDARDRIDHVNSWNLHLAVDLPNIRVYSDVSKAEILWALKELGL